jgi:hypothetical protein
MMGIRILFISSLQLLRFHPSHNFLIVLIVQRRKCETIWSAYAKAGELLIQDFYFPAALSMAIKFLEVTTTQDNCTKGQTNHSYWNNYEERWL